MTDLLKAAKEAGVAGMGGAGFPAHIKLKNKVDVVIANGAECEPLMWSDYYAVMSDTSGLIEGVEELKRTVGARKAVIAVKAKRKELAEKICASLKYDIQLFLLDDYYPAGDEMVLIKDALGMTVPEGKLPTESGVLVSNVSTILKIHKAAAGEPFTTRFVTVSGGVRRPFAAEVPLGTEFSKLIEFAGGTEPEDFAVMEGGVMMGRPASLNDTVRKTTSGIVILPADHPAVREQAADISRQYKIARSVCDQCYACSEVCPRLLIGHRIEPHKIMRMAAFSLEESAQATSFAAYCCLCGLCSLYACPLGISPRRVIEDIRRKNGRPPDTQSMPVADPMLNLKRVPMSRLIYRLALDEYYKKEVNWIKDEPEIRKVRLMMLQHRGEPAVPVVKTGDKVQKGNLIARAADKEPSLPVHASIGGKVTAVNKDFIEIEK